MADSAGGCPSVIIDSWAFELHGVEQHTFLVNIAFRPYSWWIASLIAHTITFESPKPLNAYMHKSYTLFLAQGHWVELTIAVNDVEMWHATSVEL